MSAIISPCGKYRYRLTRGDKPRMAFVMLNPSTADADLDDPTIRRCVGFARREGAAGIEVMNIYAFRATDPKIMRAASDPFGDNDAHLGDLARRYSMIVCAWGASVPTDHARRTAIMLREHGAALYCLGRTISGQPKHPLYLAGNSPLIEWSG